jgi:hypothetical protein
MVVFIFATNFATAMHQMNKKFQPLYDQASTHVFSDWIIPYALGVGVEDLTQYYFGGFPDLSGFLTRDRNRFRLNEKKFRDLVKSRRTRFGKLLQRSIQQKIFVDLGCGIPEVSVIPRLIAQGFLAKSYVGVDSRHVKDSSRVGEFKHWPKFHTSFIRADLLKFLKSFQRTGSVFFYLAGLEPYKNAPHAVRYLRNVRDEISKIVRKGDLVFVGAGTPALEFSEKKFKRIYSDFYQELFRVL